MFDITFCKSIKETLIFHSALFLQDMACPLCSCVSFLKHEINRLNICFTSPSVRLVLITMQDKKSAVGSFLNHIQSWFEIWLVCHYSNSNYNIMDMVIYNFYWQHQITYYNVFFMFIKCCSANNAMYQTK